MLSGSFERNNPQWQLQQLGRQIGEWIELQFSKLAPKNESGLPQWQIPSEFWEVLFKVCVLLMVLTLIWQVARLLSPYLKQLEHRVKSKAFNQATEPALPPSLTNWLRRARDQQRQGNYREACRALYMAMLQRLHDTQQVLHQPSRTDGEYRQVVQTLPKAQACQLLINTHEQVWFGDSASSAEIFDLCQKAYREIDQS
ncbi:MAG: DUF4129 domain-containing protein [Scytolyngbya sp. HA4215-MV1]|jgi:hypothetical protein|nr:DUF4129 domain-containing protein [Scytolyngbya sp. HA4215-MV1]